MFTKEQISKMKEDEFQNTVLIPLFRAMKFRDVTAFGGGNLELGKDIVMWEENKIGQRINYGVVVKAVEITGNAKSVSGAFNVLNQVRQCLKTPYLNPANGREEQIHRCFIVSSKIISKEAINSIKGEMENNFDKVVAFIHPGTNLYQLIDQYLPEQNIFQRLTSVQEELDNAMKIVPYRIVADSDKKFSIIGKHEKAHEELPFTIQTKFKFDTTPEGQETLKKLEEHFAKGSRVEIAGKFIESLDFPDFLPDWMKPSVTEEAKLILGENRYEESVPLWFRRKLATGETINSDVLDFEVIKGTEQITLTNDKQEVPLKVTLTLNQKEKTYNINFTYQFYGFNVYQHLQGLRLFNSMAKDGEMTIYRADSGIRIGEPQTNKINLEYDYHREIKLLEALYLIQQELGVVFTLPQNGFTNETIKDIFEVVEVIKTGKLVGTGSQIKTDLPLELAKEHIKIFADEKLNSIVISYSDGYTYNILGNEINLGVAVVSGNVFIAKCDFEEIERNIEADKDPIEVKLNPENGAIIIDFLNWKCEDRHTRLEITES